MEALTTLCGADFNVLWQRCAVPSVVDPEVIVVEFSVLRWSVGATLSDGF